MPQTRVLVFKQDDEYVPLLEWLDEIPQPALAKCIERIRLLGELGSELRRPLADYLRDGIFELRAKAGRVNYRLLYFFHGRNVTVVSHGFTKEDVVPDKEIERAITNRKLVMIDPEKHTEELDI